MNNVCVPSFNFSRASMCKLNVLVDNSKLSVLGVMCILQNHTAQTLLPLLRHHLRNGTTVHSDQWTAYNQV